MSSSLFRVIEHTSPCQHIREYPRGTKRRQEDNLRIAIKQYTPRNASPTNPDAVTIIAAPSNGFPKVRTSIYFAQVDIKTQVPKLSLPWSLIFSLLPLSRNATSLYGMNYLVFPQNMDSRSDQYGQRRCHIKEKVEY